MSPDSDTESGTRSAYAAIGDRLGTVIGAAWLPDGIRHSPATVSVERAIARTVRLIT